MVLNLIQMKKVQNNSFDYRGELHYEENGKYFYKKYGTKLMTLSKKEFEKRQKQSNGT